MNPLAFKTVLAPPVSALAVADGPPTLTEIFAGEAASAAATGFAMAHLRPGATVLWIQDHSSRREGGRPYLAGLGIALNILHLEVGHPRDALWAMEQGLSCPALAAVVGEVWSEPAVLDFTATRRVVLRAEAHGVRALLIRRAARPGLSAARLRWRVDAVPSGLHDSLGDPRWRVALFRSRRHPPGEWVVRHRPGTNRLTPESESAEREAFGRDVAAPNARRTRA